MNTTLDKQNETSETAMVSYLETCVERATVDGQPMTARAIWKAAQREMRLQLARSNRPFGKRARKEGKRIARQSWRILREVRAEISAKVRALRGLDYLEA